MDRFPASRHVQTVVPVHVVVTAPGPPSCVSVVVPLFSAQLVAPAPAHDRGTVSVSENVSCQFDAVYVPSALKMSDPSSAMLEPPIEAPGQIAIRSALAAVTFEQTPAKFQSPTTSPPQGCSMPQFGGPELPPQPTSGTASTRRPKANERVSYDRPCHLIRRASPGRRGGTRNFRHLASRMCGCLPNFVM